MLNQRNIIVYRFGYDQRLINRQTMKERKKERKKKERNSTEMKIFTNLDNEKWMITNWLRWTNGYLLISPKNVKDIELYTEKYQFILPNSECWEISSFAWRFSEFSKTHAQDEYTLKDNIC